MGSARRRKGVEIDDGAGKRVPRVLAAGGGERCDKKDASNQEEDERSRARPRPFGSVVRFDGLQVHIHTPRRGSLRLS